MVLRTRYGLLVLVSNVGISLFHDDDKSINLDVEIVEYLGELTIEP